MTTMSIDLDELATVLRYGACGKIILCAVLTAIFNHLARIEYDKPRTNIGPFEVYRSLALACFWTVAVQAAVLIDPFLFNRDPSHGLASASWLEGAGWAVAWGLCPLQLVRAWLGMHVTQR